MAEGAVNPGRIEGFFTTPTGIQRLTDLRAAYQAGRQGFIEGLRQFLPNFYSLSKPYVDAINDAFYSIDLPDDAVADPRRKALSVPDRERCLIALLGARGAPWALAVHVYVGLMEGIVSEEIAHIIYLAGIYSGVSNLIAGIATESAVLDVLEHTTGALDPGTISKAIQAKFPPFGS